jgi:hypothetical protein
VEQTAVEEDAGQQPPRLTTQRVWTEVRAPLDQLPRVRVHGDAFECHRAENNQIDDE